MIRNKKILVVEDEIKIATLLEDYLLRETYEVSLVHDGAEAIDTMADFKPDFVILDLMLPGKDGLSICKEIRQFSNVPIMMLTAKVDEIDRLLGLELGADDYVCKPFSPREVIARIKGILRRCDESTSRVNESGTAYRDLKIDVESYQCSVQNKPLELTPVEFRILLTFVEHPGRVFSRDRIMDVCYSDSRVVSDRTIDTHIKNLRKKLAAATQGDINIYSIYGVGYKIE